MTRVNVLVLEPRDAVARAGLLLETAVGGARARVALVFGTATLVIGSAQHESTIDRAACARLGVAIVRRGSGGGAVLCDEHLLEVDVAVPADDPLAIADVTESYRWVGDAWVEALAAAGVSARTVTVEEARGLPDERRVAARAACYAGLSPYEVVVAGGRKVVGLAQRRRRGAVLYQCSIALRGAPARVAALLAPTPGLADALALTASLEDLGVSIEPAVLAGLFLREVAGGVG